MSTISMYYYQVFDFSGVYVHRAQSRHCTQWYVYFVSPSSSLFQRRQSQQYFIYLRWAGEQANCWQTLTWELRGAPISRIGEKSELQASRRAQNWGCTSEERSGGDNFGWTLRWLKKRIGSRWQNSSCLGTLVRVKLLTCFFPFLASRRYFSFWIELIVWFFLGNYIQPIFSSKLNLIVSGSPWFPGICWWSWHIDRPNWQPYFCYSLYGRQGLLNTNNEYFLLLVSPGSGWMVFWDLSWYYIYNPGQQLLELLTLKWSNTLVWKFPWATSLESI